MPKKSALSFYVLVRGKSVLDVNWAGYGKKGVYAGSKYKPEPDDKVIKVKEAKPVGRPKASQPVYK